MDTCCAVLFVLSLMSGGLASPARPRQAESEASESPYVKVYRDEFPFLTAITYNWAYEGCGGALIDTYVVLTSAKCIKLLEDRDLSQVQIQLGGRSLDQAEETVNRSIIASVSRIMKYPDFDTDQRLNIGLLFLAEPSFRKRRIDVDRRLHNRQILSVDQCYYAGYNPRKGGKPLKFQGTISHNRDCWDFATNHYSEIGHTFDGNNEMCVLTTDRTSICSEDGFPYFCDPDNTGKYILFGVGSWSTCASGYRSSDSFFVRAGMFREWIMEQVRNYRTEMNDMEGFESH